MYPGANRQARRQPTNARYEPPLSALLSLRPWRTEMLVVLGYIVATRVWALSAAKVGFQAGPMPLFLTDMALLALIAISMFHRGARLLFWASSGTQAGVTGFAVWLLCAAAVVYFLLAFPNYRIYAVRDFAIFGYSLFYPLTYFAISNRKWAVRALRYFVYSGLVAAMLILVQSGTGINLVGGETRMVFGQAIRYSADNDYGGVIAFSLVGFASMMMFEHRRKRIHLVAALLCFVALADTGTRSAFVGVALAASVTFLLLSHRYRLGFVVFVTMLAAAMLVGAWIPDSFPGAAALQKFYLAIASAFNGSQDADAAFRMVRWKNAIGTWLQDPLFGAGFGRNILNVMYLGDWSGEKFNMGMPHNTFLFLLARMGLIGFSLVVFCWAGGVVRIAKAVRRSHQPDELAALNILVAMAGFGAFVLFFERPMNNASFWIMLAVAQRLVDTSPIARVTRRFEQFRALNLLPNSRKETGIALGAGTYLALESKP